MEITQVMALRGPNRHHLSPVIEAILDTKTTEPQAGRLAAEVATMAINYQQAAGVAISFRSVMPGSYDGVYRIAFAYRNEAQARAALELAVRTTSGERLDISKELIMMRQISPTATDTEAERARRTGKTIVAVTGTNGKTTVVRLIAAIMQQAGKRVGWTSTEGSWYAEQPLDSGDNSGPQSARLVLLHPEVEVAVLETARGGILREGLAFDRADVGVVTNVSADHVGLRGVNTVAELARVKQVVIDAVKPGGTAVLNADNQYTAAMIAAVPAGVRLIVFGLDKSAPALAQQLANGGTATYREGDKLLLAHDRIIEQITSVDRLPISLGGVAEYQLANALAAAAATYALGVPLSTIADALASFHTSMEKSAGRWNLFKLNGATVIIDYVHNEAAANAIGPVVMSMPANRRIIVPMSAGDRRDDDIIEYGAALGKYFDYFVLKDARHRRGRRVGEMAALIERGVRRSDTVRAHTIETVLDDDAANQHALDMVQPGDLLLISDDEFAQLVMQLKQRGGVPITD